MGKTFSNRLKSEDGFTLIDVAIALMVIGLLTAPLIAQYNNYARTAETLTMDTNFGKANEAIRQFYFTNGRYPCPADPTLNETSPLYGEEDPSLCDPTIPDNPNIAIAPARDVDTVAGVDNVWIGTLPFKDLKLTPKEALDPWGNKINYAISSLLAVPTLNDPFGAFNSGYGLITITQAMSLTNGVCDPTVAQPPPVTNIHYAFYSNGRDGVGAYNANGLQAQACPAGGATLDEENCNNDANFTFPTCATGDVAGANFYDDRFFDKNMDTELAQTPTKMWKPGANQNDTGTDVGYIGVANPDPQSALDVVGNIRAERSTLDPTKTGLAHASEYCDPTGTDCFEAKTIAGDDPNMACTDGQGMSGIGSNKAKCSQSLSTVAAYNCKTGEYISGISAGGTVTCAKP